MIAFPTPRARMSKDVGLDQARQFSLSERAVRGVVDLFSRAGLSIIGFKVHNMSVAEAEEFYRPVLDAMVAKLTGTSGRRARVALEEEFGVAMNDSIEHQLGELIGPLAGRSYWEGIIQFMAGTRPSECSPERHTVAGNQKCVALVSRG